MLIGEEGAKHQPGFRSSSSFLFWKQVDGLVWSGDGFTVEIDGDGYELEGFSCVLYVFLFLIRLLDLVHWRIFGMYISYPDARRHSPRSCARRILKPLIVLVTHVVQQEKRTLGIIEHMAYLPTDLISSSLSIRLQVPKSSSSPPCHLATRSSPFECMYVRTTHHHRATGLMKRDLHHDDCTFGGNLITSPTHSPTHLLDLNSPGMVPT